jgi:hypothetical protein
MRVAVEVDLVTQLRVLLVQEQTVAGMAARTPLGQRVFVVAAEAAVQALHSLAVLAVSVLFM